jgi:type IV pilus assembly protein PilY1
MNRRTLVAVMLVAGSLSAALLGSRDAEAVVSNADYTAVPAFVSNATTPNIIVVMDNSGSMSNRACESSSCGTLADGSTSTDPAWTNTTRYSGYFDSLRCYTYNTTDTRFESGTGKTALATACSDTEWDGNFLNWATLRRFDAVKRAMIGGDCASTRATDGTCPASGTPALKTVRAQAAGLSNERADVSQAGAAGRIPLTDRNKVAPQDPIYVHISDAYFCLENDTSLNSDCGDSSSVRKYHLKVGYTTEPTGVIQQIGSKARFGLVEFKSSSEGARMLVGAGSRQSIDWADGDVETFTTNTAAMVDAVQESYPSTWTPLAEALYETARYVAQIQSTFSTGYVYPIAFSGGVSNGVNFATSGAGSIGTSEIKALVGSETCPAGYITNACGRDPYFLWAKPHPTMVCQFAGGGLLPDVCDRLHGR